MNDLLSGTLDGMTPDDTSFDLSSFARRDNFHTDHYPAGQVTTQQVVEDAQNCSFLDGGTDYGTPLNEAIRLMEENEYRNADIAFITDTVLIHITHYDERRKLIYARILAKW